MPVPHQPPNNIPLASSLPKVSYRKIPEDEAQILSIPAGVQDQQHVNFGFNDGSQFEKPEHYLRYVEPIESELSKQVEYDMDEQDQEWLEALNLDRRREQLDSITYELFEIIIDRLEKEWFDLMKRIPQKALPIGLGPDGEPIGDGGEDIDCAICDDGECENSNAIVFCDGCNLAVHQDCYGIPYIPEGQWLCRKCTVSPDRAVSCVLCPHEGGAFKQTTQGKWAHLLCAMWIPETGVSNPVYMEPIDSVERIPKARWRLQCYICRDRIGACIQCENKNCFTAFHVTCGRKAGLLLKTERQRMAHTPLDDEEDENGNDGHLRAWCHKHLPKSVRVRRARENEEYQDAYSQPPSPEPEMRDVKRKGVQGLPITPAKRKSARAYRKSYRMNISLVPAFIVNRVVEYIGRVPIRKKPQLVIQIAKFWSLKREARRGAPLLKRLHLEPWTATSAKKEQSDVERLKKLRFLLHLREDLEKVRMLAELVRKREREKQRQAQVIRSTLIDGILFPYNSLLCAALERIAAMDRSSLFLNPVSVQVVPDYYEIVKKPMDWTTISNKLDEFQYTDVQQFKNDVVLVLENAMLYNKVDTPYHRTAARILHVAGQIFVELEKAIDVHAGDQNLLLEPEDFMMGLLHREAIESDEMQDELPKDIIEDLVRQSYPVQTENNTKKAKTGQKNNRKGRASKANENRALQSEHEKGQGSESKESSKGPNEEDSSKALRRSTRSHYVRSVSLDTEEADTQQGRSSDVPEPTHLEVSQVDSWDSFKRFNVGWVLPEGQKRSRMKPQVDKIGQSDTKLAQSQSLASGLAENDLGSNRKRSMSNISNSDGSRMKRAKSSSDVLTGFVDKAIEQDEKVEIPIRRSSSRRSKMVAQPTPSSNSQTRQDRKGRPNKGSSVDKFVEKTLCWAKFGGHPFFPAEVYDEKGADAPKHETKHKSVSDGEDQLDRVHLVRFFDSTRTFGWVPESKLRMLFEDDELDQRMLKSPTQPRQRAQVRAAFDRARKEAE